MPRRRPAPLRQRFVLCWLRRPSGEKIVSAVRRGISKAQAARTFDVSLSSVKRYANKVNWGESLAPKKSPGSAPKLDKKARKLLEDDLKERPTATLQSRCDYIEVATGLSVSRSTICRAIARPRRIRELIEERGCELMYLPAYSPDYNPIEESL